MSVNSFSQALAGNPTAPLSTVIGPQAQENTYRWATVTQRTPSLAVQLDGDSQPLPLIPDSLIEGPVPAVGARVWVQLFGRRVIVLGVSPANSGVVAPGNFTAYTPTFLTPGATGTVPSPVPFNPGTASSIEGWYSRIGDTVTWQCKIVIGTTGTSSIGTEVIPSLPQNAQGSALGHTIGGWIFRDTSTLEAYSGNVGSFNAAGTHASLLGTWNGTAPGKRLGTNVGNSWTGNPFVMDVGDVLSMGGTYRAVPL